MRFFLSAFLVFLTAAVSTSVFADKATDKKKALEAFNQGIELYKNGDMAEAVKKFRYADALNPSWKLKYNIGQCEASLKRYGLAIDAFEQYLGEGGDEVPIERRDEVLKELDRMRKMVGTITVTGEPGIDVYIESIKHGNTSAKTSIKVTAGVEHEITFMRNGEKLGSVKLTVSGGEVVAIPTDTMKPSVVAVSQPTTTPPPRPPRSVSQPPNQQANELPPEYSSIRQIKEGLRAGAITKIQYRTYERLIKQRYKAEIIRLKNDVRARVITEREYKIGVQEAKRNYEGQ